MGSPYAPTSLAGDRVKLPATLLMVVLALNIVGCILGILMHLLGIGGGMMGMGGRESAEGMAQVLGGGIGLALNALGIFVNGFGLFAALKMKSLDSYAMAWVATIIAMLPCAFPCCCLGIGVGIWAIVVLVNADVKASFRA